MWSGLSPNLVDFGTDLVDLRPELVEMSATLAETGTTKINQLWSTFWPDLPPGQDKIGTSSNMMHVPTPRMVSPREGGDAGLADAPQLGG